MIIGQWLLHWMKENKMTYRKLAREVGVDYVSLHRLSHGRDIEAHALLKVLTWASKKNGKRNAKVDA